METVRATEELLDQLIIRQAGDVGGADGDLRLPSDSHGLVGGAEGLFPQRRRLVLQQVKDVREPGGVFAPPPISPPPALSRLTSLVPEGALKGGLRCSSCSLSSWASRRGCKGEPARDWQKMAFTGDDLNLQGINAQVQPLAD